MPGKLKWYYVAEYLEEDIHSRDYGKTKHCICSAEGRSRRGLRLDSWVGVWASDAADAKARARAGEGQRYS